MSRTLRIMVVLVESMRRPSFERCLASLEDQTRLADDLIVIDPASHDGLAEWVQQNHPRISTLRLFQFPSLAYVWKKGVQSAFQRLSVEERLTTWILCTRGDLLFDGNALALLEQTVLRDERLLVVSPTVLKSYTRQGQEYEEQEQEYTEQVLSRGTCLTRGFVCEERADATHAFMPATSCVAWRADQLHLALAEGACTVPFSSLETLMSDAVLRVHPAKETMLASDEMRVWRKDDQKTGLEDALWFERVYAHGWFRYKTLPWRWTRRIRTLFKKQMKTYKVDKKNGSWVEKYF